MRVRVLVQPEPRGNLQEIELTEAEARCFYEQWYSYSNTGGAKLRARKRCEGKLRAVLRKALDGGSDG